MYLDDLWLFFGIFMLVAVIIGAIMFVIQGLFLYRLGDMVDDNDKWKAFVPVFNVFYRGKMAAVMTKDEKFYETYKTVVSVALIGMFILSFFTPMAMFVPMLSLAMLVMIVMANYRIFTAIYPDSALLMTILFLFDIVNEVICLIVFFKFKGKKLNSLYW